MSFMGDLTTSAGSGSLYTRTYGYDASTLVVGGVLTLPTAYVGGTLDVFFNGIRLRPGLSNDYVETSPAMGTITLLGVWASPSAVDVILVDYDRAT
jgi:hypothetical protein